MTIECSKLYHSSKQREKGACVVFVSHSQVSVKASRGGTFFPFHSWASSLNPCSMRRGRRVRIIVKEQRRIPETPETYSCTPSLKCPCRSFEKSIKGLSNPDLNLAAHFFRRVSTLLQGCSGGRFEPAQPNPDHISEE